MTDNNTYFGSDGLRPFIGKVVKFDAQRELVSGQSWGWRYKVRIVGDFSDKDREAFNIIQLAVGTKWDKIQNQFKKLVKKYHPDMNAGSKKFEEKLKIITLAYTQLKLTYKRK